MKAIIDFGSRSTKVYISDGEKTELVMTHSKDMISQEPSQEDIARMLETILASLKSADNVNAIATEAARRSATLDFKLSSACREHKIGYEKISQEKEAELIQQAFTLQGGETLDIINAGGGSIQISRPDKSFALLPFGIADLNRMYALATAPGDRRVNECVSFVADAMPQDLKTFVYTGGEVTYLRKQGAVLGAEDVCAKDEFLRVSRELARLPSAELEARSPFDKSWMSGAVASNCIVEAAFRASGAPVFYPSDQNIAHGMIRKLMGRTA
jgi:exopolyphosphatase/pppGpp-phosphohydrolase